jgi:Mrp family chromosome partitioning ATPase
MRELINQLTHEYDLVVLDGPPVLGLADAPILSAIAESTVFVIEASRSRRGSLKGALRRLRSAHSHVIGCVLTKFDAKKAGAEYSNYDYYTYGEELSPTRSDKPERRARS